MNDSVNEPTPMRDDSEFDRLMLEWALDHNLSYLVRFHNVVRALLAEKIRDAEAPLDRGATHTLQLFQEINAANALLLLIGYLEENLSLLWQDTWHTRPPNHTSIVRYRPLLVAAGIDLGSFPPWAVLNDAMRVRHCIMHANRRLSLVRDSEDMRLCLQRYPGDLLLRSDRIVVTSRFLKTCVGATRDTFDALIRGLESRAADRE